MPDLNFTVTVRDDGSAVIQQFADNVKASSEQATESVGGLTEGMGQFVKMGAGLVGVQMGMEGVKSAVHFAVDSFMEAERAGALFTSAVNSSGIAAQLSADHMRSFASELSDVTTYSKHAIESVEAMLLRFGVAPKDIDGATQATLDFSSAMGRDAESSAFILAKAIDGTITNLHRYGIDLNLSAIPATERATAVLDAFNKKFAGTAEAMAKTSSGEIQQLKNQMSELAAEVGKVIVGKGTPGEAVIYGITQDLKAMTKETDDITSWSHLIYMQFGDFTLSMHQMTEEGRKREIKSLNDYLDRRVALTKQGVTQEVKAIQELMAGVQNEKSSGVSSSTLDALFGKDSLYRDKEDAIQEMYNNLGTAGKKFFDTESIYGDMSLKAQLKRAQDAEKFEKDKDAREWKDLEKFAKDEDNLEMAQEKKKKQIQQAEFSATANFLQAGAQLSATFGAKNVALNKAFQISQAIINTSSAVVKALAEVPFPADIPYAASLAAMGAAQIATIAGVSDSGASAGNVSSLGSASGGGATGGNVLSAGGVPLIQTSASSGPSMNIVVQGFVGDESKLATEIGRIIREANGDGVSFGLQTTRR